MRAVKERKRLVALLAVLFLMSGVFSVIAAASPEDTASQNSETAGIQVSDAVRIQTPKAKKLLFEQHRSEQIAVRIDAVDSPSVMIEEPVEETVPVPEESAEPFTEEYESEYIAQEELAPAEEQPLEEYAEYTEEPVYFPETTAEEAVYTEETVYEEPVQPEPQAEYIPEEEPVQPEYIPEEAVYVPEPIAEPEPIPEPEPVQEPEYTAEPETAAETVPEPLAEEAPAPVQTEESSLTYLGNFMLTAYCPCSACCGAYATGRTASGTIATEGVTVAMGGVEFGTKVSINGHIYTVEDRGTAYGHVDIFFADHGSALAFGLQYADVYLVE